MNGKQAARNFARGYQIARLSNELVSSEGSSNDNWFVIRDRDLDSPQESIDKVILWGEKEILTGLTCIESYFLSPIWLQKFIETQPIKSPIPINHDSILMDTFHRLKDYQAIRWSLQELRERVRGEANERKSYRTSGQFDLPNRLSDADGKLPASIELDSCRNEAIYICEQFGKTFNSIDLSHLNQSIDKFLALFNSSNFQTIDYQKWFHGKDVLKLWLRNYPNVSVDTYCKWAAYNLDWTEYPDLVEIQRICQS